MLLIILLVLFTMVMFLWLLALLGAGGDVASKSAPWLAFFACLFLGVVVFLYGTGVIVVGGPAALGR
jgi:hypothetical protein